MDDRRTSTQVEELIRATELVLSVSALCHAEDALEGWSGPIGLDDVLAAAQSHFDACAQAFVESESTEEVQPAPRAKKGSK